jgi:predicted dehydrogenase
LAAFPLIVPACVVGRGDKPAPSERVVTGCIGVGDRGRYLLGAALGVPESQVVAVCDVKRWCADEARGMAEQRHGKGACAVYDDFRELAARDDIDACLVGSCDHWHVLHALAAVRSGKAVYVEKPLGLTVEQDQALRAAVRKRETVFQFGTQQRSDPHFRHACNLARGGHLGELREIRVWAPPSESGGPTEEAPVPEGLDYDFWLGPAPYTPHTKDRTSNAWWWFVSDYAVGFIAGWGIHPLDIALWGAGGLARTPVRVSGTGEFPREGLCDTATAWHVDYNYDSGLHIDFRQDPPPAEWAARYGEVTGHGTVFEGSEGWVHVNRRGLKASPAHLAEKDPGSDDEIPDRSANHMKDFFDSVRLGREPASPIECAVESDIACHVADIAIREGRPLRWDPAAERFENGEKANARLSRPMRGPWTL